MTMACHPHGTQWPDYDTALTYHDNAWVQSYGFRMVFILCDNTGTSMSALGVRSADRLVVRRGYHLPFSGPMLNGLQHPRENPVMIW